jgi:hypothetical protein
LILEPIRPQAPNPLNPNPVEIVEFACRSPPTGRKSLIFTENVLYWAQY